MSLRFSVKNEVEKFKILFILIVPVGGINLVHT